MDMVGKIIKEIEDGIRQSIDAVKSKATLVIEKADELTEEGKRQYRLYDLKSRRQKEFASLGEKLHSLIAKKKLKTVSPDLKKLAAVIDKTNAEIGRLEGAIPAVAPKKAKKAPAKPKAAAKKKTASKAKAE